MIITISAPAAAGQKKKTGAAPPPDGLVLLENGSFWRYRLCWMTPEEKEGGPDAYLDNRCRSSDPDDFLSRIEELA